MKRIIIILTLSIAMVTAMSSCKDESEGETEHLVDLVFDKNEVEISANAQTLTLTLLESTNPAFGSLPSKWDKVRVTYYPEVNPDETLDNWVPDNNDISDIVTCSQSTNDDGSPVITVNISENNTGKIRAFVVDGCYEMYKYNYHHAECTIIQSPKKDDNAVNMKVRYRNRLYTTTAELDSNGEYVFKDDEFAQLVNSLENNRDIEQVIIESGVVDYIDVNDPGCDEYLNNLIRDIAGRQVATRAASEDGFQFMENDCLGYFGLFDNDHFKGKNLYSNLTNYIFGYNLPNLKIWDMNDKITSLAVAYNGNNPDLCSILTIWEDTNFNYGDNDRKKHRISIVASYWNRKVSMADLKQVKCLNSSSSWNDRISTVAGHFGYWGRTMLDY